MSLAAGATDDSARSSKCRNTALAHDTAPNSVKCINCGELHSTSQKVPELQCMSNDEDEG
jgi:hypothetical protein